MFSNIIPDFKSAYGISYYLCFFFNIICDCKSRDYFVAIIALRIQFSSPFWINFSGSGSADQREARGRQALVSPLLSLSGIMTLGIMYIVMFWLYIYILYVILWCVSIEIRVLYTVTWPVWVCDLFMLFIYFVCVLCFILYHIVIA